ncbi:hypothetical protein [Aequorivita capsosiphonis]|uniref:hypothetical protein n=1 Tax=Aequorivita capsosiphonis TaxID=487317 RepID=UPI0003F88A47|nr:hypothetical protein [Aequorivita capsosiphonis]
MTKLFLSMAILSGMGWGVGFFIYHLRIMIHLLLILTAIFVILKMMWEESSRMERSFKRKWKKNLQSKNEEYR